MRNLNHFLIGVIFLVTPFFISFNTGDLLRVAKLKICLLIGVGVLACCIYRRMGLGLASFYFASAFSALYVGFGVNQAYTLLFISFAFVLVYVATGFNRSQLSTVLFCLSVSGFLCTAFGYLQMAGIDPIMNYFPGHDPTKPTGLFGQHTLYGPWVVCCLIAALYLKHYILVLFMIPSIVATTSALTLFALFGSVLFYLTRFVPPKVTIAGVILCILGGLVGLTYMSGRDQYFSGNGRYTLWKETIEMTEDKKLFGHGIGTFRYIYHKHKQSKESRELHGVFLQAHSDPIEVYFELGLIGLLTLLIIVYDFIRGLIRKTDLETWTFATIAFALALNSVGNFPFQLMPHALLGLFSIMIVTRKTDDEYKQTSRSIHT